MRCHGNNKPWLFLEHIHNLGTLMGKGDTYMLKETLRRCFGNKWKLPIYGDPYFTTSI